MAAPERPEQARPALLRGRADEDADYDDALQNLLRGAYREWPNDAGVGFGPLLPSVPRGLLT